MRATQDSSFKLLLTLSVEMMSFHVLNYNIFGTQ
jgi:hypothetical protein